MHQQLGLLQPYLFTVVLLVAAVLSLAESVRIFWWAGKAMSMLLVSGSIYSFGAWSSILKEPKDSHGYALDQVRVQQINSLLLWLLSSLLEATINREK